MSYEDHKLDAVRLGTVTCHTNVNVDLCSDLSLLYITWVLFMTKNVCLFPLATSALLHISAYWQGPHPGILVGNLQNKQTDSLLIMHLTGLTSLFCCLVVGVLFCVCSLSLDFLKNTKPFHLQCDADVMGS